MKKMLLITLLVFTAIILLIIIFGYDPNAGKQKPVVCNENSLLQHVIIENKIYDIPAKSQVTYRIGLYEVKSYTKTQLQDLIKYFISQANNEKMKFHNPPSHIFIYIYESEVSFKNGDGGNWIAMFSKTLGDEGQISIK